ncbi:MAG: hypothetical protein MJ210_01560 [Alphaproteobacteria bacterium]|nr:hypothetical protein [Alphaproteobacteria bacterium]
MKVAPAIKATARQFVNLPKFNFLAPEVKNFRNFEKTGAENKLHQLSPKNKKGGKVRIRTLAKPNHQPVIEESN